jgi:hypothetical protein
MRLSFVVFIGIGVPVSVCLAQERQSALPPLSQMVPRAESSGTNLAVVAHVANWVNFAAATVTYLVNNERLEQNTENALKSELPNAGKVLIETGAR